jgi:uncharacterized cofD-like protein
MLNTQTLNKGILRWLAPGLQVKRWVLLMIFGVALIGLGVGYVLVTIYREIGGVPPFAYYFTLQFIPRLIRALFVGGVGAAAFVYGFIRFSRSLLASVRQDETPVVDKLWDQRIASNGSRIVAIGGGHGLAALLRGIKNHTNNITAIVTVADDGGSSGRLRQEMGILPPGDFRMCISALANEESLVTQLMQYRFAGANGLSGHAFGNLFIAAMAQVTGSFEKALLESSKVVASKGRILPSTLRDVVLCAEHKNAVAQSRGESSIGKLGLPIERVWLEPHDPPAFPDAVKAILEADIVVLGPGSLFTSVMPNLLVKGVVDALRQTSAPVVYVCNVATERGETDRFTLDDHVDALERHIGRGVIDIVIANNAADKNFRPPTGVDIIQPVEKLSQSSARLVTRDVVDADEPWRHDSAKLAQVVLSMSAAST